MARILALSSSVAEGRIGLAAILPALDALGHEVIALPTILLSNHPGHAVYAGEAVSPALLERMLGALEANGRLAGLDAVLTGYMPGVEHVALAVEAIQRIHRHSPDAQVFCDPIAGDDPKGLYVPEPVAAAIRSRLVPLARCLMPNRFELAWLTGCPAEDAVTAATAAWTLGLPSVLVSSIPAGPGHLETVLVEDRTAYAVRNVRRERVPHGTGDLLSALFAGHRLAGTTGPDALALSVAGLETIVAHSLDRNELCLPVPFSLWTSPKPLVIQRL